MCAICAMYFGLLRLSVLGSAHMKETLKINELYPQHNDSNPSLYVAILKITVQHVAMQSTQSSSMLEV